MKIFIVTKGVRRHTINRLDGKVKFTAVTNTDQGEDLPNALRCYPPENIGIGACIWMRNWIEENLVEMGEWYLTLDDNIRDLVTTHPDWWNQQEIDAGVLGLRSREIRRIYEHYLPGRMWPTLFQRVIDKAEELGTTAGGLSYLTNPMWRRKQWLTVDFCQSGAAVYKKTADIKWRSEFAVTHDKARTCETLAKQGSVALFNHGFQDQIFCEEGGIGPWELRASYADEERDLLAEQYPGLFTHIRGQQTSGKLLIKNNKRLQIWRKEHGYV